VDSGGPRNGVLDGVEIELCQGAVFRGKEMADNTAVSGAKMAGPITMPFGLWSVESGGLKEAFSRWGAHWRHLANAIEPSVFGGNVAFLSNYFDHLLLLLGRRSSMVCLSVSTTSPAKTAELIETLFGIWTLVGPRNYY